MAHVRKDSLVTPGEWAKHLRPYGKKAVAHAERQAAKKEMIEGEVIRCVECKMPIHEGEEFHQYGSAKGFYVHGKEGEPRSCRIYLQNEMPDPFDVDDPAPM